MRILYIAPSIPVPGFHGGSTHVLELGRHLVKLGCEIVVLARRLPSQSFHEYFEGLCVYRIWRGIFRPFLVDRAVGSLGNSRFLVNEKARKIVERLYFSSFYLVYVSVLAIFLAKKHCVDVVLERGDSYGCGAVVSMILRKPLVTEIRDIYQPLISLLRAKRLLTYNPSIIRMPNFRPKAFIMYGGVDVNRFKRAKRHDQTPEKVVVGYAGSLVQAHMLDILPELAKLLINEYGSRVRLLLVGPYTRKVLEEIRALGLSSHLGFTGPVAYDKILMYLKAVDIAVALYDPLRIAGPPYKVYEYMASEIPVITTETLYTKSIVEDGVDGFLVKTNSTKEVLSKISALLDNPSLREKMGRKAREVALKYSWTNEAKRILLLLSSIVQQSVLGEKDFKRLRKSLQLSINAVRSQG